MTPIEWIALILAVGAIVKILIIAFSPKTWLSFVKKIYSNPKVLLIVEVVLGVIVFYYLLKELTLVQIFAAIALGAILTGIGLVVFTKDLMVFATRMLKQNVLKKAWLPLLIWIILSVWVLMQIFNLL